MACEPKRGCGYRKIGGVYLMGSGIGVSCDRLPIALTVCPVCSHGFKQSRGWQWVDVAGLVGGEHKDCKDEFPCPLCMLTADMGKAGLLWIGEKFYSTPAAFIKEGMEMGVSRRIKAIPRGFKVGETWVLLAHPKTIEATGCPECEHPPNAHGPQGCRWDVDCECELNPPAYTPGIFRVWCPQRIEKIFPDTLKKCEVFGPNEVKIVPDSEEAIALVAYHKKNGYEKADWQYLDEDVQSAVKQGMTPVFFPANDRDHLGTVYDSETEEETDDAA